MPLKAFQSSLFAGGDVSLNLGAPLERVELRGRSWFEHHRGYVQGADSLFSMLATKLAWEQGRRWMYEREVDVPRLTAPVDVDASPIASTIRDHLSARYHTELGGAFAALYRDGRDSVAWHSDKVDLSRKEHLSAIVSLGGPRKFLLRPKGGGSSIRIMLESGDLLVLGGAVQHHWEHCVPKVAHAHPRIALLYFGKDRRPPRFATEGRARSEERHSTVRAGRRSPRTRRSPS